MVIGIESVVFWPAEQPYIFKVGWRYHKGKIA